ncbi:hypothetical protein SAMIE_1022260 [Sphingobium amiense]|uniref:Uncharacterized protein n=1 Tax=Sphingobium amiense TaxID=135719 RepID=A0A494WDG6_9SPHN|nr:hypothetical protein SAMIE_1022260 [Sphingobium amiense]
MASGRVGNGLGWKAVINSETLHGSAEACRMARSYTKTDKFLMAGGALGLAASRIIPVPKPVLIVVGVIVGLLALWLSVRALIRRRKEKLEDRDAAWNAFVRDRNVS